MWKMNGEAHRSQMWEKKSLALEMWRRWLKCIEVYLGVEWFIAEGVKESEESKTASQPGLLKETKQTSQARGKLDITVYDAQVSYSSQKRCHQNDVIRIILWLKWKRLLFVNWVFPPPPKKSMIRQMFEWFWLQYWKKILFHIFSSGILAPTVV